MSIKIKARIIRELFHRDDYYILACTPLESNREVKLNQYGGFTIVGNLPYLTVDHEYELEIVEGKASKYGINYVVKDVPTLAKKDLKNISDEEKFSILKVATSSDRIANNILNAYPNFIEDVVTKSDEELTECIDLKKIKGVGETYFNAYKRILKEKYKYIFFVKMEEIKAYDLTIDDAKILFKKWSDQNYIINKIKENPYNIMIEVCGKSFKTVDTLLKKIRPDLIHSEQRCEAVVMDILHRNEYDGHSRLNGHYLFRIMKDSYNCEDLKDILVATCEKSSDIYYDKSTKDLSLFTTYMREVNIASYARTANNNVTPLDIDIESFRQLENGITLTDEQLGAVRNFKDYNFSILAGFGGAGKTSSVLAIVNVCKYIGLSMTLLAPTGSASLRLTEATNVKASTIHLKCLKDKEINTDVLIVDECSMVDLEVFSMMMNCISNPNIRIVLVGDYAQLVPVGIGTVFADLIQSKIVPTTILDRVFRYGNSGIAFAGANTRQGRDFFDDNEVKNINGRLNIMGDWDFYERESDEDICKEVITQYKNLRAKHINKNDILVLSAYNVDSCGTYKINELIQEEFNPPKKNEKYFERKIDRYGKITFRVGDRVINKKNNYSALTYDSWLEIEKSGGVLSEDDVETTVIFNGQRGDVVDINDKVMVVKFDEQLIVFDKLQVYNLLLGYAISVHASQGQEANYVICVVTESQNRLMNRNLLYVGNTRAKKHHINVGQVKAYKDALLVDGVEERATWLLDLLTENIDEKTA